MKEGSGFGLALDQYLLFNPNHATLNELPIDVLAQLRREEAPAYSRQQMVLLTEMGAENRSSDAWKVSDR